MTTTPPDLAVWPVTVNTALLGTDRAPLIAPTSGGALGIAYDALVRADSDAASNLLRLAAAARWRCGSTSTAAR